MNQFPCGYRISSFSELITAYVNAGIPIKNAVDGGAGSGSTSKHMLKYVTGLIYAFEPFPGNHRFFDGIDGRIKLIPKALYRENGIMPFSVRSVVSDDSVWGKRGMAGYSSVGKIDESGDRLVECARGDDEVPGQVDFIKLDLQRGELDALKGMERLVQGAKLMWVEYMGQRDLLRYLQDKDFDLFETEYFFMGEPSEEARMMFDISREDVTLSTDKKAWYGYKKDPWSDYVAEFSEYRKKFNLIQTDLICINLDFSRDFDEALKYI